MAADILQYLISEDSLIFDYPKFTKDFTDRYPINSSQDDRKSYIRRAVERLKANFQSTKQLEFELISKYPSQEYLMQAVLSEENGTTNPLEQLDRFLTHNYAGLYYDEILDANFYMKGGETIELDIKSMFLRLVEEEIKISEITVRRFLESKERIHFYNPIKDFFNNLPKPADNIDYIRKFVNLFDIREHIEGVSMKEYSYNMLKKYFIRTLSQLFGKGMQNINKLSLCLVSPRGSGKTTFVKEKMFPAALVSEQNQNKFFTDSFNIDIKDTNSKEAMCSNWIIFLDEFNFFANQKHNVSRKELNDFKKFTGNTNFDIVRYGDKRSPKRISSFIFCVNPDTFNGLPVESLINRFFFLDFLNGEGNRLPFEQWNEADTLAMWSQIYTIYKQGATGQLTVEEENQHRKIMNYYMMQNDYSLVTIIDTCIKVGTETTGKNYTPTEVLNIMLSSTKVPENVKVELQKMGNTGLGRKILKILREKVPGFKRITDHTKSSHSAYRLIVEL